MEHTFRVADAVYKPNPHLDHNYKTIGKQHLISILSCLQCQSPTQTQTQSNKGNVYILVIADYFTRWIEAYPLPNQTAEKTANALLYEFMSHFGFPFEIHSDQGRNFQSDLFQELCKILGVTKTHSTPYHPASNGLVERFNQTLAKMIRSFIEDHPKEWDKHLPLLTAAYRCTVHPTTGFTPKFLMFGREVNIPQTYFSLLSVMA